MDPAKSLGVGADIQSLMRLQIPAQRPTRMRAALAAVGLRWLASRADVRLLGAGGDRLSDVYGRPTMVVHDPVGLSSRLAGSGLVGLGEAYQAGEWDGEDLADVLTALLSSVRRLPAAGFRGLYHHFDPLANADNTVEGDRANIHYHYDVSNHLFSAFLDSSMTYSSGLFEVDKNDHPVASVTLLHDAQIRKIDRILDIARVGPGSRVLEVGTGWGELAIRAARRGAIVRSLTISAEQQALAVRRIADAGVADRVVVDLSDYRCVDAGPGGRDHRAYDAVVSVEMIEAVGPGHLPVFLSALDGLLAQGGLVGLQAITMDHGQFLRIRDKQTWLNKYVFPGGVVPSVEAMTTLLARHTTLQVRDNFSFGAHYAATLRAWRTNFNDNAMRVTDLGFDRTFRRTWNYYLASCEAGFRTRLVNVRQLTLSRG